MSLEPAEPDGDVARLATATAVTAHSVESVLRARQL
jgi:hypothetical protein